jgi:hypothetical protein
MPSTLYLSRLDNALREHNKLKNDLKSDRYARFGILQEATELQKPTTDTINKSTEKTIEKLDSVERALVQQPNNAGPITTSNLVGQVS